MTATREGQVFAGAVTRVPRRAVCFTTYHSPLGRILIGAQDAGIFRLRILTRDGRFAPEDGWKHDGRALAGAVEQLAAYFAGELREFSLNLHLEGTPFQQRAWSALRRVGYGESTTYTGLATAIGSPRASRAVGRAMSTNPISILLPCHRVLGSGGRLTGYLNGLDAKQALLAFESANRRSSRPLSWQEVTSATPTA